MRHQKTGLSRSALPNGSALIALSLSLEFAAEDELTGLVSELYINNASAVPG